MATKQTHRLARLMMAPSVAVLLLWMIVPLALTMMPLEALLSRLFGMLF